MCAFAASRAFAAAAARGFSFQADDLANKALIVGKHDVARVQHRQKALIEIGFWLAGRVVSDAAFLECFARPLARISVAADPLPQIRSIFEA